MKFKVPGFFKKLIDSKRIEEIESRLNDAGVDTEEIDDKVIDRISEKIAKKEIEEFRKEFSQFGKSVTDRGIVDIKYLVKEINVLSLALIQDKNRGKLRYFPEKLFNKEYILRSDYEYRYKEALDKVDFFKSEIDRLVDCNLELGKENSDKSAEILDLESKIIKLEKRYPNNDIGSG